VPLSGLPRCNFGAGCTEILFASVRGGSVTASPHSFCFFGGAAFVIRALASLGASLLRPGWESLNKHFIFKPGLWPLDYFGRPFSFRAPCLTPLPISVYGIGFSVVMDRAELS
jgi:hypothetical protein